MTASLALPFGFTVGARASMHWTDYEGTGARYLTIDRMPREDRLRILNGLIVNRASYLPVRLQPPRHHHPRAARHQRPGSRLQPDARRLELRQAALTNRRRGSPLGHIATEIDRPSLLHARGPVSEPFHSRRLW